jgi:hypothetical protein
MMNSRDTLWRRLRNMGIMAAVFVALAREYLSFPFALSCVSVGLIAAAWSIVEVCLVCLPVLLYGTYDGMFVVPRENWQTVLV